MANEISPPAQALLDGIERGSGEGRGPRGAPSASGTERAVPNNEIGRLVDDVVTQTEQARLRLAGLSDAIEDIAWRLGLPLEASVAALQQQEDVREPPSVDVVPLPTRESAAGMTSPPAPTLVTGERLPAKSAPAGVGPRVPVEEQAQVLGNPLARRAATPLEQPPASPDADEHPFEQEESAWMGQAMQLDACAPSDALASPVPPPAPPPPVAYSTMGAAPPAPAAPAAGGVDAPAIRHP